MKKLILKVVSLCCFVAVLSSATLSVFGYDSIEEQEIEIVSLRDENTKHFKLPDGSYRADVYSYPIHYWDEEFGWVDIEECSPNSRAIFFPVTPDPEGSGQVIFDTQISRENPTINYGRASNVVVSSYDISFFNVNIPFLPDYASISSATLELKYYFDNDVANSAYATLGVYRVMHGWEENNVTFNSMSTHDNQGIHRLKVSESTLYASANATSSAPKTAVFDITFAARHWYGFVQETYGVAIKYTGGNAGSVNFCTYENTMENRAKFTFNYTLWEVDSQDSNAVSERTNLWNAGVRKTKINGTEYFDYTIPIENFLRSTVEECEEHRCDNDLWVEVYPSFYWFYTKVNGGRVWDLKHQPSWQTAFPSVPYINTFVYKNQIMTPEDLGNFAYGYNGRAMCFGPITLYWGGGVAAQRSFTAPATTIAPLYGDSQEDHDSIEMGINYFQYDYPEYYAVTYDQIPDEEFFLEIANWFFEPSN